MAHSNPHGDSAGDKDADNSVCRRSLFVAAIDFGTTFCGFAFSMLNDYDLDPLRIMTKDNWLTHEGSSMPKTPSAILFKPDHSFHSFGYEAETDYMNLFWNTNPSYDEDPRNWYFFRNYKMLLYKSRILSRDTVLTDDMGKSLPAIYVFSQSIKFLRDCLWELLEERVAEILEDDIFWVLTVPAIWSDKAKQFMREATVKAGIPGSNLTLALEPEAAAVFCKGLLLEKVTDEDDGTHMATLPPGTGFMVIDMGGGTIDLTVYEVLEGEVMHEVYPANGGNWGGNVVNIAFLKLVEMLVGENVYKKFKEGWGGEFLQLEHEFECKKRRDCKDTISITLPSDLVTMYENENENTFTDNLRKKCLGNCEYKKGRLILTRDTFQTLFSAVLEEIVDHVTKILRCLPTTKRPGNLIFVGGFADCNFVSDHLRRNFPDKRIIVPNEALMAVIKGAVLFGRNPSIISGRVIKHTYGIEFWPPFKDGEHPNEKKTLVGGKWKCDGVFRKHVEAGTIAKVGVPLDEIKYTAIDEKQDEMCLPIFVSTEKAPKFVTDDSCTYLGSLNISMKDTSGGCMRSVYVRMIFEGTEFAVQARDETTGAVATTKVDFLG